MKLLIASFTFGIAMAVSAGSLVWAADEPKAELKIAQKGNVKRGAALYSAHCMECHAVDGNNVGPAHRGVVGRKAGSAKDYAYSDALRHADIVWTEKTLGKWLEDPEALIPGQKMNYSVSDRRERDDLIAFLKSVSKPEHKTLR